ncbi:MAG: hypothetical protein IIB33_00065 [Chloroflexi bacterium]|nr:hypothetical protein [Chloroflexota bacterium]
MLGKFTKALKVRKKDGAGQAGEGNTPAPGGETPVASGMMTPQPPAASPLPSLTLPPPPDLPMQIPVVGLPDATAPLEVASAPGEDTAGDTKEDDLMSLFTDEDLVNQDLIQLSNLLEEVDISTLSEQCREIASRLKGLGRQGGV